MWPLAKTRREMTPHDREQLEWHAASGRNRPWFRSLIITASPTLPMFFLLVMMIVLWLCNRGRTQELTYILIHFSMYAQYSRYLWLSNATHRRPIVLVLVYSNLQYCATLLQVLETIALRWLVRDIQKPL